MITFSINTITQIQASRARNHYPVYISPSLAFPFPFPSSFPFALLSLSSLSVNNPPVTNPPSRTRSLQPPPIPSSLYLKPFLHAQTPHQDGDADLLVPLVVRGRVEC